jgi:hypothetical protein
MRLLDREQAMSHLLEQAERILGIESGALIAAAARERA